MTPGRSLAQLLEEAESHAVQGWSFTWLGERMHVEPLPWDFRALVSRHADASPDLLDLDTGGGEWLAALPGRPARTVATESWPPNVDLAGARLRPLGVTVVRTAAAPDNVDRRSGDAPHGLPFPSESYALVSCRHSSFVAGEVARVLVSGGVFVSQQVGGSYDDFHGALGLASPPKPARPWSLDLAKDQLEAGGLRIEDGAEAVEVASFADVGALAWYLRAVPWTVRGFSIGRYRPQLERLHDRIANGGPLTIGLPAFWVQARKA